MTIEDFIILGFEINGEMYFQGVHDYDLQRGYVPLYKCKNGLTDKGIYVGKFPISSCVKILKRTFPVVSETSLLRYKDKDKLFEKFPSLRLLK